MEILHSAGRVGMRVRIPFSECSVTVTFIFGPIGVRWRLTCSVNHMFSRILWLNYAHAADAPVALKLHVVAMGRRATDAQRSATWRGRSAQSLLTLGSYKSSGHGATSR